MERAMRRKWRVPLRQAREALGQAALKAASRLARRRYVALQEHETALVLEQPANAQNVPRWGHGRPWHPGLTAALAAHHSRYDEGLALVEQYGSQLRAIPREPDTGSEPCWTNPLFIGIDGAVLYSSLRERNPRRYLEIGSGYSTKFAARAKRDGGLQTEIVSIDPAPQAEVDALCDRTIRGRLEDVDVALFEDLEPGDILFLDGSHRVFMNNDVSTFWLDVLPRIQPGVLVGIHDVFLPEDYPPGHADMHWTEQYLIAVALLFGDHAIQPVFPCHYVCVEPGFQRRLRELWDRIGLGGTNAYGSAFWFELATAIRG